MDPLEDRTHQARQDAEVPHVVRPQVAVPDDVAAAVETLRSQLRVEMLRVLRSSDEPMSGRQLATAVEVEYERSFQRHLNALEDVGVIVGTPAPGERQGQLVLYAVVGPVLDALLSALTRHLQGSPSPPT